MLSPKKARAETVAAESALIDNQSQNNFRIYGAEVQMGVAL